MVVSFPLASPAGIDALTRSLNDPRVMRVAESLQQNLQDPATLRRLLAKANEILSASAEVSLSEEPPPILALVPGQSAYVRNAIRTYLEIAAMK